MPDAGRDAGLASWPRVCSDERCPDILIGKRVDIEILERGDEAAVPERCFPVSRSHCVAREPDLDAEVGDLKAEVLLRWRLLRDPGMDVGESTPRCERVSTSYSNQ